jgi:hypothetical protein
MGKFNMFVGAYVSEMKVNSDVETEWFWLTGDSNPTDLGIRTGATPQELIAGYEYQEGMGWMRSLNQNGLARSLSGRSPRKKCKGTW